jgi:hypothetical protein
MKLLNYFDSFFLVDWLFLFLKIFFHLSAVILFFLFFKILFSKLIRNNAPLPIELLFAELFSAWVVLILYVLYFLILIFVNGTYFMNFNNFSISIVSIYFILSPFLLSLSVCVIFIVYQNQKIKNILQ